MFGIKEPTPNSSCLKISYGSGTLFPPMIYFGKGFRQEINCISLAELADRGWWRSLPLSRVVMGSGCWSSRAFRVKPTGFAAFVPCGFWRGRSCRDLNNYGEKESKVTRQYPSISIQIWSMLHISCSSVIFRVVPHIFEWPTTTHHIADQLFQSFSHISHTVIFWECLWWPFIFFCFLPCSIVDYPILSHMSFHNWIDSPRLTYQWNSYVDAYSLNIYEKSSWTIQGCFQEAANTTIGSPVFLLKIDCPVRFFF